MMKLLCLCSVLLTLSATALSQDWAKAKLATSPRHQEWVDVKNGNRTVKTLVVYPERKDKAPVVIVIHEIFGMSDWAMLMADDLAAAGYIAVEPDLLSGMGPNGGRTTDFNGDQEKITEAVSSLAAGQVLGDLTAVADYAKTIPSTNGKLNVCGFCWGGGQSFHFATVRPDLKAAFVFYGIGPQDPNDIAKISAPVYGFYAGMDERVGATIDQQKVLMKAAGKKYDVRIYDGAGHGFMRAGEAPDAKPGNKDARDKAWKTWLRILRKE